MSRLIPATLILVSSAALAGPHLGGPAVRATAGAMSHAAPVRSAVVAPTAQLPQYQMTYGRDGHPVHRDPAVNRLCSAQQRSSNACLDRGWNVTVPSGSAPRRNVP